MKFSTNSKAKEDASTSNQKQKDSTPAPAPAPAPAAAPAPATAAASGPRQRPVLQKMRAIFAVPSDFLSEKVVQGMMPHPSSLIPHALIPSPLTMRDATPLTPHSSPLTMHDASPLTPHPITMHDAPPLKA